MIVNWRRSVPQSIRSLKRFKTRVTSTKEITPTNAQFDQAWDQADYRLSRFQISPKQVNPNIAQKLIAEAPVIETTDRIVFCDGEHPALGHPRIYINLDKPGNHSCNYCGQRFVNTHVTQGDDRNINHLVNT